MNMKSVFFFVTITLAIQVFANLPQLPFSEESAKKFITTNPNLKEVSSQLCSKAFDLYATKDLPMASTTISTARVLEFIDDSKIKLNSELFVYILSTPDVLENLSSVISPKDNKPQVFGILNDIWTKSPADFKEFQNLAIAIAIVFDTQPPESYPHHQVSTKLLPRKLQPASDAFNMWVNDRRKGRLLSKLENMSIEELKFLVASVLPKTERSWAQKSISANANTLAKLYSTIKYDNNRLNSKQFSWENSAYSLENIKSKGGICTDQSFFTSEVAKAKGLPAFILSGAGSDGFHAWVGYMVKSGKWDFSVGRFASGKFVTGQTFDPQTWEIASSHLLESMSQSFRRSPKYRLNELHTLFAGLFIANEKFLEARSAAENAIKSDLRNFTSWLYLLEANEKLQDDVAIQKTCMNAMKAFARSPDNDAYFRTIMIEKLNKSGKKNDAKKMSNAFVIKNKNNRPDLAMEFARMELLSDIEENDVKKLKSSYKRLLGIFKNNLGMTLDGIVIPVLQKLHQEGKTDKINDIVEQTRQIIKKSKDETIQSNFEKTLQTLGKTK